MPILKDFRTTKKIVLPDYSESEVEIYDDILAADIVGIDETDPEKNILIVVKYIKDWNFTDENGANMLVNVQNLKLLKINSFNFLLEEINKTKVEKKKE